jgi:DNA-binding transcriptional MerR regulator
MPRRPPDPSPAYAIDELAKEAGVTIRAVRHYVSKGLLPYRPGGTWFFRYDEAFRRRLLAIVRLRRDGEHLPAILARLEAASPDEIAVLAGLAPARAAPAMEAEHALHERWERIPLRAGLELHLRADAHPDVVALARRLEAELGRRP